MKKCVICSMEINGQNNSAEHLIPNAIGGKRKISGFICQNCNSSTGDTWDAELTRQLLPLSHIIGVIRERGETPPMKVTTTKDEKLIVHADGTLMFSAPTFEATKVGENTTNYQITARSMDEARRILEGLKRKHPDIDVETIFAQTRMQETYHQGAVLHNLPFGGEMGGRSIVKTCMAMAFASGIHWGDCEHGLNYLRSATSPACFGFYTENDLIAERTEGLPLHCVSVKADPKSGLILAYVEYFGIYRIVACLGEHYAGPYIQENYAINPRTGEVHDVHVDLPFQRAEINEIYAYQHISSEAMERAVSSIIGPALERRNAEEQSRVIHSAVDKAFETCGAIEGEALSEEHMRHIARSVAENIAPFLLHRMRPPN